MKEAAISINKPVPSPIKKIGSMVCTEMQVFGDIVIIWGSKGEQKAFTKQSLQKKQPVDYQIDNHKIKQVVLPKQHEIIILETSKGIHVRDYQNRPLPDAEHWADYFIEPHTQQFYRQNKRGNWFDIEGHKLTSPIFLLDDVLVSLIGKKSKQSLAFKGQPLFVSPQLTLIQVGKVVFNQQLQPVRIFGEKITGLGKKYIEFGNGLAIQEVQTGFNSSTFIEEQTKQPFLINDEPVVQHVKTVIRDNRRYEVFKTADQQPTLSGETGKCITCENQLVKIDFSTYTQIGTQRVVKCTRNRKRFFMDLEAEEPFRLQSLNNDVITDIAPHSLMVNGRKLRNVNTANQRVVYDEMKQAIFQLNDQTIIPSALQELNHFSEHLGIADINGQQKIYHKKSLRILQLGEERTEVSQILTQKNQKLLNAISTKNEPIVLDARKGFDQLTRAYANGQALTEVYDYPRNVGRKMLQNARLNTLGGTEKRVIDLNTDQIDLFTLPATLSADSAGIALSLYAGNPILAIHFQRPVALLDEQYFEATFLPLQDTPRSVLIQEDSGLPLHLEGSNHKNQLVTSFLDRTLKMASYIGNNRMIGADTLSEDGQESHLLFSFQRKSTWIPFGESALPVTKEVVNVQTPGEWDYLLYEVQDVDGTLKYMVVEKEAPHRVLVERIKGKESPKLLEKAAVLPLKIPKRLSNFAKFFVDDPGYLREV
ncbi:MAG: hypothetical protein AAGJ18_16685 [Bacteroidota bacterium]